MELTRGLVVDKASILEMIVLQSPTLLNEPFKVKEPESSLPWTAQSDATELFRDIQNRCKWASLHYYYYGYCYHTRCSKQSPVVRQLDSDLNSNHSQNLKAKKNSLQNVDFSILSTTTFWMFAKVRGQISKLLLFLKGSVHFFLWVFHLKCKENFDLLK